MALSNNLVNQFVKNTTNNTNKKTNKETFMQGYIVKNNNGQYCVKLHNQLNSQDLYIPVKITTNVNINQPVTVMIKNHSATVIGNAADAAENDGSDILNNTASFSAQSISDVTINALWKDYFNK